MADAVTIHVAGLDELRRKLRELPDRVERHVVRHSVSDAAAIVRNEMREQAPEWTGKVSEGHAPPGTLKRAVFMKYDSSDSQPGARTVYVVGVRHGKQMQHVGKRDANLDAWYFFIVEFGRHNGKGRHSFMRPAFDAKKDEAKDRLIEDLANGIAREASSL